LADTAHDKTLIVFLSYNLFVGELSPEEIPVNQGGFCGKGYRGDFLVLQNLVRFAHNWNVGTLEHWNIGFWETAAVVYWQNPIDKKVNK